MSIIKRLANIAKGAVSLAGKEGDELEQLERQARERALQQELDNPRPSEAARRELHRRKTGVQAPAPEKAPEPDELARLKKALDDGILTRAEYEQKKAEAIARQAGPSAEEPEIKRTL